MTKEIEQLKGRVLVLETNLKELVVIVRDIHKETNKELGFLRKAILKILRIFRE